MAGNDRATVSNKGGRPTLRTLSGLLAVVAIAWAGFAQAQDSATTLTAVEVQSLAGNALEVRLRTSGRAPEPMTFTIDNPARLSVDLPDVGLALDQRRIDVNAGGVDSIVAAEAGGRTRVVFNLDSLVPYAARAEGDSVIVTLGGRAGAQTAQEYAPAAAPASGPRSIAGIDFRRSADGAGRVIVKLSDVRTPASLKQEGNRVIVDFTGARLPEKKPAGVRCDSLLCRIIPASQPYRLWHTTFRVACRPCATCSRARPMAPLSLAGSSTFSP